MSKIIYKWTVPVDDRTHQIGGGPVVHVDSQSGRIDEVQVWTQEDPHLEIHDLDTRTVKVVGTGQEFNDIGDVVGSVVVSNGNLVWHVVAYDR
jgi:hypothetical protein